MTRKDWTGDDEMTRQDSGDGDTPGLTSLAEELGTLGGTGGCGRGCQLRWLRHNGETPAEEKMDKMFELNPCILPAVKWQVKSNWS